MKFSKSIWTLSSSVTQLDHGCFCSCFRLKIRSDSFLNEMESLFLRIVIKAELASQEPLAKYMEQVQKAWLKWWDLIQSS